MRWSVRLRYWSECASVAFRKSVKLRAPCSFRHAAIRFSKAIGDRLIGEVLYVFRKNRVFIVLIVAASSKSATSHGTPIVVDLGATRGDAVRAVRSGPHLAVFLDDRAAEVQ